MHVDFVTSKRRTYYVMTSLCVKGVAFGRRRGRATVRRQIQTVEERERPGTLLQHSSPSVTLRGKQFVVF